MAEIDKLDKASQEISDKVMKLLSPKFAEQAHTVDQLLECCGLAVNIIKTYRKTVSRMAYEITSENAKLQADLNEAIDVLAEIMEYDGSKGLPERDFDFLSVEGKKAMAVLNKHRGE